RVRENRPNSRRRQTPRPEDCTRRSRSGGSSNCRKQSRWYCEAGASAVAEKASPHSRFAPPESCLSLRRGFFRELQEDLFHRALESSLFAQALQRSAADESALMNDADTRGQFLNDVERMSRQEDRCSFFRLIDQNVLQLADTGGVEAHGGLVHNEDLRLMQK